MLSRIGDSVLALKRRALSADWAHVMSDDARRAGRLAPRNRALSDEAIDWIVRLGSGSATDEDRTAFEVWRSRSPAHAEAAAEATAIMGDIGETRHADEYRNIGVAIRAPVAIASSPRRISRRTMLTGGATVAAAGYLAASGAFGPTSGLLADHATGIGGREKVALEDGSVVWLNTASALSVDYSGRERRLTLHEGEALFEVAKDKARPFIVAAGNGEARAVGTVYSVRRRGALNDVVVREGIVEVRSGVDTARLIGGQQVAYGDGIVSNVRLANSEAATAWARGKLIFNRRPLGEVATELERYQFGKVVVRGGKLKHLEVTGVFSLGDNTALLRAIAATVDVPVSRLPWLTIIG